MFLGSYVVSLDQKGRIAIPKRFRAELGTKLVVARWYEGCFIVVSNQVWQTIVVRITNGTIVSLSGRDTDRFLLGGSFEVELDQQGRFVIPEALRSYAKLSGEAVCMGLGERVEVWDKKLWEEREKLIIQQAGDLAEKLFEQQKEYASSK